MRSDGSWKVTIILWQSSGSRYGSDANGQVWVTPGDPHSVKLPENEGPVEPADARWLTASGGGFRRWAALAQIWIWMTPAEIWPWIAPHQRRL